MYIYFYMYGKMNGTKERKSNGGIEMGRFEDGLKANIEREVELK